MVYYRLGDVIKELRDRLHMTQEELADGICSVSSVAKIEGGSQMPSGRIAEALLRRLKDAGCFFTGFAQAQELEELYSWERMLAHARKHRTNSSRFENQLYAYVRVIERMQRESNHAVLLLDLMEILVMSMPLEELYDESARRRTYTYLELYILNSIAVQFYYMESFDAAERILERLCVYLREWHLSGEVGARLYPVTCNNLTAVKLSRGELHAAKRWCEEGLGCSLNAGMLHALPSLYGNLSSICHALRETTQAQLAYSRMQMLCELLRERRNGPVLPEAELLKESCLMSFVW